MLPASPKLNTFDGSPGDTEFDSKGGAVLALAGTDGPHLFFGQLGLRVCLARHGRQVVMTMPAFANGIVVVVPCGPEEQMGHIAAKRLIAVMADVQTFRNGALCRLPGEA